MATVVMRTHFNVTFLHTFPLLLHLFCCEHGVVLCRSYNEVCRAKCFLRSYLFQRWKGNPLHFMKPEGLLPCLPTLTTCSYPTRTVQSMPSRPIFLRSISVLSTYQFPCLPSGLFSSDFPTKSPYAFLASSIIPHGLILPDLITQVIFG